MSKLSQSNNYHPSNNSKLIQQQLQLLSGLDHQNQTASAVKEKTENLERKQRIHLSMRTRNRYVSSFDQSNGTEMRKSWREGQTQPTNESMLSNTQKFRGNKLVLIEEHPSSPKGFLTPVDQSSEYGTSYHTPVIMSPRVHKYKQDTQSKLQQLMSNRNVVIRLVGQE